MTPEIDPTLPTVPLMLDGQEHQLCFTFGALALAESKLRKIGIRVNLLHALDLSNLDASTLVPLLYSALITHEPEITIEGVAKMVTFKTLPAIFDAIGNAYAASLAEADKDADADPTEPQPE